MRSWGLVAALCIACGDDSTSLRVDLRTDFLAPEDFDAVEIDMQSDGRSISESPELPDADWLEGARVVEVEDLAPGPASLRVTLTKDGRVVAMRPAAVLLVAGRNAATVTITRTCASVQCAEEQACLGGRCVDPECLTGAEPSCPREDECNDDASCAAPAGCAVGICREGTCLYLTDDAQCDVSMRCDFEVGCVAVPLGDGGAPDSGVSDGGVPDALDTDASDIDAAGVDAAGVDAAGVDAAGVDAPIDSSVADDASGGTSCTNALECDDGNECTTDTCPDLVCVHTPLMENAPCSLGVCVSNVCTFTCDDLEISGDETDVDCGGSCSDCLPGSMCSVDGDCRGQSCTGGRCDEICVAQADVPLIECHALEALYDATNGDGWSSRWGWLQTASPCGWHGVQCSGGRVERLDLGQNRLIGTLPDELGNLTRLQRLRLRRNQLSGSIPTTLGNLVALEELELTENRLTGTIPSALGMLPQLEVLEIGNNMLTGPLPASIAALPSLTSLYVENNMLSGALPVGLRTSPITMIRLDGNGCFTSGTPELTTWLGTNAPGWNDGC